VISWGVEHFVCEHAFGFLGFAKPESGGRGAASAGEGESSGWGGSREGGEGKVEQADGHEAAGPPEEVGESRVVGGEPQSGREGAQSASRETVGAVGGQPSLLREARVNPGSSGKEGGAGSGADEGGVSGDVAGDGAGDFERVEPWVVGQSKGLSKRATISSTVQR
jgi:hypothetical protein